MSMMAEAKRAIEMYTVQTGNAFADKLLPLLMARINAQPEAVRDDVRAGVVAVSLNFAWLSKLLDLCEAELIDGALHLDRERYAQAEVRSANITFWIKDKARELVAA